MFVNYFGYPNSYNAYTRFDNFQIAIPWLLPYNETKYLPCTPSSQIQPATPFNFPYAYPAEAAKPSINPSEPKEVFQNTPAGYSKVESVTPQVAIQPITATIKAENKPEKVKILSRQRKFTMEEDKILKEMVDTHGRNWSLISRLMHNKDRKQVKDRYDNFLCKKIKRTPFTPEEDKKIIDLIKVMGNKFSKIAEEIEGRAPIMIKNRYYTNLKKIIENEKLH